MTQPDDFASPEPATAGATRAALADGAVLRWWQVTAFLDVAGPDAPSLLDGLCTQAVERIAPGTARLGLFLDAKARIIAPAAVHRLAPRAWTDPRGGETVVDSPRLMLETLPELVEPLRAHLARYRLRAKATIEPVELSTVALVGDALPTDPPEQPHDQAGDDGEWIAAHGQSHPTLTFLGSAQACADVVRSAAADGDFVLADPDAFEADRIERGIAGLHDLLPGHMPAEVGGMDAAVALDAGCYLGQEPVARLHYRGHANRVLRRLTAEQPLPRLTAADPESAAHLLELRRPDAPDGRPSGRLTSWATATADSGHVVALGVIRREVAAGELLVMSDGTTTLRVADDAPDPAAATDERIGTGIDG